MTDRQVVHRALRLFMEDVQAIFRRRARRAVSFLKVNPPCHTCAFNPATLKMRGLESTANSLRQAIDERRPFFCHVGWPWRKPIPKWGAATLRRFLRECRFCSGWVTVVGAPGLEKAFERAGVRACRESGQQRLADGPADTTTSPARRGDMTRDRATTQQPMQRPAEMSTAGGSVTRGTDQMPSTSSRIPGAECNRVGALRPGDTSRRVARNEALRGVGSAGGGPAAGDVMVSGEFASHSDVEIPEAGA